MTETNDDLRGAVTGYEITNLTAAQSGGSSGKFGEVEGRRDMVRSE
jgi:hypothetical protein